MCKVYIIVEWLEELILGWYNFFKNFVVRRSFLRCRIVSQTNVSVPESSHWRAKNSNFHITMNPSINPTVERASFLPRNLRDGRSFRN